MATTTTTTAATTTAPTIITPTKTKQQLRQEELKSIQKREKIIRRAIPLLLTIPWILGILWTTLHPILSIITGELKCRGKFIDENGLDVHRHRVASYPLERRMALPKATITKPREGGEEEDILLGGMCDAISSRRSSSSSMSISPSIECLRHDATETISFDVVRILPSLGPVIESSEAVVLFAGQQEERNNNKSGSGSGSRNSGDWYERSDMNASILHLIQKLGSTNDCPWLTKTVFVVSPAQTITKAKEAFQPPLGSIVDAFISSYMGINSGSSSVCSSDSGSGDLVRSLPPAFTFPMIRSMLVLSDIAVVDDESTSSSSSSTSDVRILPQGTGGTLPNLDLVFATYSSLQSHPLGRRADSSRSLYYGNSEVRMHPYHYDYDDSGYINRMEKCLRRVLGRVVGTVGEWMGWKESNLVGAYVKDLGGLVKFIMGLAIGPRAPHASALHHGIDALTIELRIPNNNNNGSHSPIHPHYADVIRCTEHLLRSISNLHERLHHSIAQYIMPSPSKFVSHGEYLYPAILVALPMVVRAATLALRDLTRFRFGYVGAVLGTACVAASIIAFWAAVCGDELRASWITYVVFSLSYMLVILTARREHWTDRKGADDANERTNQRKTQQHAPSNDFDECRKSLRFVSCLVGIYLHAPLLLANYSLGFPSSAFWSPLLATLVLSPSRMRDAISGNRALSTVALVAKCVFLIATCPSALLVPRVFRTYTPYVLGVYAPLHLLLAALWLA